MPFWNQVRGLTIPQLEKAERDRKKKIQKMNKLIKLRNDKPELFSDLRNHKCFYCQGKRPKCSWCKVLRK